jgi:GT2 family glycosyltransferase
LTPQPFVAIVILNWNGKQYLDQFLPSILSTSYTNSKVIIADNASTDGSVDYLKNFFPQTELIKLDKNYGFARGYNEALKKIKADYYVLLNSDVEVNKDWLQPIIMLLEKNEKYAACQPKIMQYNNKKYFDYAGAAGGWLDNYGYPFARGRVFDICEEDHGQYDATEEVFWASGAALVIKGQVYHEMGGMDDYFFAHQEEIDLCWRLQLKGYKIFCCPLSTVYHVGGGTLPRGESLKTFLNFRNNHIMLFKNLPLSEKWWKIPYRLTLDQISASKALFNGDFGYFKTIIKAHIAFFRWLIFHKKKKVSSPVKLSRLTGVYKGNVVWQYFVKKQRKFSALIEGK